MGGDENGTNGRLLNHGTNYLFFSSMNLSIRFSLFHGTKFYFFFYEFISFFTDNSNIPRDLFSRYYPN